MPKKLILTLSPSCQPGLRGPPYYRRPGSLPSRGLPTLLPSRQACLLTSSSLGADWNVRHTGTFVMNGCLEQTPRGQGLGPGTDRAFSVHSLDTRSLIQAYAFAVDQLAFQSTVPICPFGL